MNFKNKKIMVVVAHPDDEVLGIGATIHKLVHEEKAEVHVVVLGEGLTSRDGQKDQSKELEMHRKCILDAQKCLGYQSVGIHQLADNRFDSIDLLDIVKIIENEKKAFKPDYVFTHHMGDLNIDHRRTFEAVMTATRPMVEESVIGVFSFETFSATEWAFQVDSKGFRPNFFVSINQENLKAKQDAMQSYIFETREYPHPRSVRALEVFARANGCKFGSEFIEAFEIIRLKLQ